MRNRNRFFRFFYFLVVVMMLVITFVGVSINDRIYSVSAGYWPPHTVNENENQHIVYSGWDAVSPTITFVMGDSYSDENGNVLNGNAGFNQRPDIVDSEGRKIQFIYDNGKALYRIAKKTVTYGTPIGELPSGTVSAGNNGVKQTDRWNYNDILSFPVWPDTKDSNGNVTERHYFIGWYTVEQNASIGAVSAPKQYSSSSICDFTEDITLYAWWATENNSKTLRFHLNNQVSPLGEKWSDGTLIPAYRGSTVNLLATDTFDMARITLSNGQSVNPFSPEGVPFYDFGGMTRDFDGWWTKPVGGNKVSGTDFVGSAGNGSVINLYAHWKWGVEYRYAEVLDTAAFSNYTISGGLPKTYVDLDTTVICIPTCNYTLMDNTNNISFHPFSIVNDQLPGVTDTWYCPDFRGLNMTAGSGYIGEGENITLIGNITLYAVLVADRQYITYNKTTGYGNLLQQEIPPTHFFREDKVNLSVNGSTVVVKPNIPNPLGSGETGINKQGHDFRYWIKDNNPTLVVAAGMKVPAGTASMELFAVWDKHKYIVATTEDGDDKINDLYEAENYDKLLPSDTEYADDNTDYTLTLPEIDDKEYTVKFVLNYADVNGYIVYAVPKWSDKDIAVANQQDKERVVIAKVKGDSYMLYKNQLDFNSLQIGVNAEKGFENKNSFLKNHLEATGAVFKVGLPYSFSNILKLLGKDYYNDNQSGSFGMSTLTFVPVFDYKAVKIPEAVAEGYELLGFDEDATTKVPKYKALDEIEVHSDMTLYTIWKPKTYSIIFDAQGGRFPEDETEADQLEKDPIYFMNRYNQLKREYEIAVQYADCMPFVIMNLPVKTGYYFEGFYTEPDGKGVKLYDLRGGLLNDEIDTFLIPSEDWVWKYQVTSNTWYYRYIYENYIKKNGVNLPEIRRVYANWVKNNEYTAYPDKRTPVKTIEGHEITRVVAPYSALEISDAEDNYDVAMAIPSTETLKFDFKLSPYVISYSIIHNGGQDQSDVAATKVNYSVTVPIVVQTELANHELSFSLQKKTVTVEVPKWIESCRVSDFSVFKLNSTDVSYVDSGVGNNPSKQVLFEDFYESFGNLADSYIDIKELVNTNYQKSYSINGDEVVVNTWLGEGQIDQSSYQKVLVAEGPYQQMANNAGLPLNASDHFYYFIAESMGNRQIFGNMSQRPVDFNELVTLLAYNWALPDVLDNGERNTVAAINDSILVDTMDEQGKATGKIDLVKQVLSSITMTVSDGMEKRFINSGGNLLVYSNEADIVVAADNGIYDTKNIRIETDYIAGRLSGGFLYNLIGNGQKLQESFRSLSYVVPKQLVIHTPVAINAHIQINEGNSFDNANSEIVHRENVGLLWELTKENTLVLGEEYNGFKLTVDYMGNHIAKKGYGFGEYIYSQSGRLMKMVTLARLPFAATYVGDGTEYEAGELIALLDDEAEFVVSSSTRSGDYNIKVFSLAVNAEFPSAYTNLLGVIEYLANVSPDMYGAYDEVGISIIGDIRSAEALEINNGVIRNWLGEEALMFSGNKYEFGVKTVGDFSNTSVEDSLFSYAIPKYYYKEFPDSELTEAHLFGTRVNGDETITFTEAGVDYDDRAIGEKGDEFDFVLTYVTPYYVYCLKDENFGEFEQTAEITTLSGKEAFFEKEGYILIEFYIEAVDSEGNIYRLKKPHYVALGLNKLA